MSRVSPFGRFIVDEKAVDKDGNPDKRLKLVWGDADSSASRDGEAGPPAGLRWAGGKSPRYFNIGIFGPIRVAFSSGHNITDRRMRKMQE